MLEAGYRCAIPTCRTVQPLEIEHIDDYSAVRRHEFHNMIVLCANCHRLKGSGPRSLDRKALRQLKVNLSKINNRYNETERRILEYFAENGLEATVVLPATDVLFSYLVKDSVIVLDPISKGSLYVTHSEPEETFYVTGGYQLTERGRELVERYRDNEPIL